MWIPNRKKKKSLQPSFRDWVTFFLWDAVDQANVDYNFNNVGFWGFVEELFMLVF